VKRLKRVGGRGPHGIEEEHRVLLFLGVRQCPFLLQLFDQVGVCVREGAGTGRVVRRGLLLLLLLLLLVSTLPCLFWCFRDRPREPGPRCVVGLVLAQDVQRRFEGVKRR